MDCACSFNVGWSGQYDKLTPNTRMVTVILYPCKLRAFLYVFLLTPVDERFKYVINDGLWISH